LASGSIEEELRFVKQKGSSKELAAKAVAIHRILKEEYGDREWHPRLDPVGELVSTILSQNTNDVNRDRAYEQLRKRFPTWETVRDAEPAEVQQAIRPAGLASGKGPAIQRALRQASDEGGEINLDFLAEMPLDEARNWLTNLNGVGPKTAAIVLLFSFNRPAFPVDTHVHRVSQRLGLIGPKVSREKAHDLLEALLPPEIYYAFHLNLIAHGRRVCHARQPRCEGCPLLALCDYGQEVIR
jgi:endonuclease-3